MVQVQNMLLNRGITSRILTVLLAIGGTGVFAIRANSQESSQPAQLPANSVSGQLNEDSQIVDGGRYLVEHPHTGSAGEVVTFEAVSEEFDTVIVLIGPDGEVLGSNDDNGGSKNAQLTIELPTTGTYWISVTSFRLGQTGEYVLSRDVQQAPVMTGETWQIGETNQASDDILLKDAQDYVESGVITSRQLQRYIDSGASREQIFERLEELRQLEARASSLRELRISGFSRGNVSESEIVNDFSDDGYQAYVNLAFSVWNLIFGDPTDRKVRETFGYSRLAGLRALIGRGNVLNEQGWFEESERTFRVALQLSPTSVQELYEQENLDASKSIEFRNHVLTELLMSLGHPEVYAIL